MTGSSYRDFEPRAVHENKCTRKTDISSAHAAGVEPIALAAAATIPAAILYSWLRKAPLSLTFAIAMIGVFLLVTAAATFGGGVVGRAVLLDLALSKDGSTHSPPTTWVTSMFTHAGFAHLALNLIFLIALGPLLEERIGPLRFGVTFFAGGLFATAVFVLANVALPRYILLGASGGLSAVFGAFGRLFPRERIRMWLLVVSLPPLPAIYFVIGYILIQFLLTPLFPGIAWEAHIGGAVFGFAAAPLIMRLRGPQRVGRVRDVSALRPLAAGPDLEESYEHLATETLPEAQRAWLERFAAKARCPACSGPLRLRGTTLSSDCGWKLRL